MSRRNSWTVRKVSKTTVGQTSRTPSSRKISIAATKSIAPTRVSGLVSKPLGFPAMKPGCTKHLSHGEAGLGPDPKVGPSPFVVLVCRQYILRDQADRRCLANVADM